MSEQTFGILRFHEQYFERIWGGQQLRTLYGKPIPADKPIGEAWLISDHPSAVSVVSEGPHAGRTLHDLVEEDTVALLGSRSKLTPHGRFPLLLKLLDSTDVLSVQVHPDDATAAALGEPDVGKTEMWHILHADPGAELICGLQEGATPSLLRSAIEAGDLERYLVRFPVQPGDSVFVRAGTVHAIGKGIVLAEIQQNSDLTYRLYDWNRVDSAGKPRKLHIDKGIRATDFTLDTNQSIKIDNTLESYTSCIENIVSSKHFNVDILSCNSSTVFTNKSIFHIIFCTYRNVTVSCGTQNISLDIGQCCLVPSCIETFTVSGTGKALVYSA